MNISEKDIAKMAGVSITTVSHVCNNRITGNMSNKTYDRVKKIIELTGYSPNPIASTLRSGLSKVLAVILPNSLNPFFK